MVEPEQQPQVKLEWAKVHYNTSMKRIYEPSDRLAKFVEQVKSHFKELRNLEYFEPGKVYYDGKDGEKGKSTFALFWHSLSHMKESFLDESINAVQVDTDEQFN